MQKFFSGGLYDRGNVSNGADRTRLHSEPVHRQVLQSDGDVGQVSQGIIQDNPPDFLSVPPRPDGRRTRCNVPGTAAEGNKKHLILRHSSTNDGLTEISFRGCLFFVGLYLIHENASFSGGNCHLTLHVQEKALFFGGCHQFHHSVHKKALFYGQICHFTHFFSAL